MPSDTEFDVITAAGASAPDERAEEEVNWFEVEEERTRRRLLNIALAQAIELRKAFAWDIFYLIVGWLFLVFVVLFLQGFSATICSHAFRLSDTVLLALIGGTTLNVLGIFVIVVRYLFPTGSS